MQFDTVSRLGRRPLPSKVHSLTTRRLQALPGARQARRARVGRALAFQDAHEQASIVQVGAATVLPTALTIPLALNSGFY